MPGRTDCTSGNLRINREVSTAHSSNDVVFVTFTHACNVETARYFSICLCLNEFCYDSYKICFIRRYV
jgi:hypothetical protein